MTKTLAIVAPDVGVISETFIRRHMQDISPGHTVVVAHNARGPRAGHWSVPGRRLILNERALHHGAYRAHRAISKKFGLTAPEEVSYAKSFLRSINASAIMAEYLNHSVPVIKLAKQLSIPLFAHAHGYDVSLLLRDPDWVRKYQSLNDIAGIITFSEAGRQRLVGIGLDSQLIHVIPYGVNVAETPHTRPCTSVVRCLSIGRMVAKKAPIFTLDAFRRSLKCCPNLHLDYVGGGELLPAARQFVRAMGLENNVTLHGPKNAEFVQECLGKADIYIQHSIVDPDTGDEEGLPVAILEAMGNTLPVVSTLHAGIPESVSDGVTGYLVEEGDTEAMSDRIIALANNCDLRRTMGQAGWTTAKERFTWEKERADLRAVMRLD